MNYRYRRRSIIPPGPEGDLIRIGWLGKVAGRILHSRYVPALVIDVSNSFRCESDSLPSRWREFEFIHQLERDFDYQERAARGFTTRRP